MGGRGKMTSLGVVEIFDSIEGEGIRTGMPVTFIRLAGCNLRCSYCDTCYAQKETDGELMSVDDIIKKVNYSAVTITGGEPLLHQQSVIELINKLNESGHYVNIETNGSIDIMPFIFAVRAGRGFFTVDYKCPCSGMESQMCETNFGVMDVSDVLKFVVAGNDDLIAVRDFLTHHQGFRGTIFISPCYNTIPLPQLVNEVKLLKKMYSRLDIRFQVQLHKIVWSPEERGV
jgi:7-carboxy-7-deazaguanine synthase